MDLHQYAYNFLKNYLDFKFNKQTNGMLLHYLNEYRNMWF